ncbi:MAG: right-handed parallel beta-helix repeat-containing protein, partial [Akkermansiaceae bacterium]
YLTGGSGATIANCTFSGNSATADAGALYFASVNGPRTVTHCIAWNNETAGSQIFVDTSGSIPTYRHCLIEGWNPAGIGNLDGTDPNNAPIFISPATPGASNVDDVNLRMMANSPTINRGDVSELDKDHADLDGDLNTTEKLPSDFDGKDRNLLGVPDLGAYESSSSVIHVDASVIGGTGSGIGWANAYSALAAALEDAQDGQQIWVAAGVYLPSVGNSNASGINDKSVSFELKNGVALYGGFAGDELALTDRDFGKNKSILSGDVDGNDGADQLDHFSQIVGTNSLHVVTSNNTDNTARIDGFIITAGQASTVTAGTLNNQSGGMLIENSHATIRNCQFTGNSTLHGAGGGFHCRGGSKPSLVNCVFRGNGALLGGAIMISSSSNATLVNCTVTRNETQSTSMNYANIYISGATASLENCIVWDNSVANASGSLESINLNSASCTIRESIVEHSFNAGVWNSSVGTDGGGNLDEDPKFVSLTDPRIHYNSPAIDAGNNMADLDRSNLGNLILEDEISTDVKGHTRVADSDLNFGAIVDMGAFEYQGRKVTDTDDDGMSDFFELVNTQPSSPTLLLPNQDPDGDNKSNLVESVFGSNTNEFDKDYPLSLHHTTSPAASYLKLTFPYNPDSANFVDLYWEYSENLSNWDGIDGALSPAGGGLYQFISNRDVSGRSKGFIRFVVKKK